MPLLSFLLLLLLLLPLHVSFQGGVPALRTKTEKAEQTIAGAGRSWMKGQEKEPMEGGGKGCHYLYAILYISKAGRQEGEREREGSCGPGP